MPVETLADALRANWRVHAKCLGGRVDNGKSAAKCVNQRELDLETLVWTRGFNLPISMMMGRIMFPRRGNRRVTLMFTPPLQARAAE